MNISQKSKSIKNVTVKHALKQLEQHKAGLLSRDKVEEAEQTDSFIRTLNRSDEDFLLGAYDYSKDRVKSGFRFLKGPETGMFGRKDTPGLVGGAIRSVAMYAAGAAAGTLAATLGLSVGPILGLAAIGGIGAYIATHVAALNLSQRERDHEVFVNAADVCSAAIRNPVSVVENSQVEETEKDPIRVALGDMSRKDLLTAYDKEISRASLSQQRELRDKREKIRLLPELGAAELWGEYPKLQGTIGDAVELVKKQGTQNSLADLQIHDAIAALEANREAQLSNLDADAAKATGEALEVLRKSEGKTLLDAYAKLEQKRKNSRRIGAISVAALAGTVLCAAGLTKPEIVQHIYPIMAGGTASVLGVGLITDFSASQASKLKLVAQAETSIQNPPKSNSNYSKIGREELFTHLEEQFESSTTLEGQSFAREASRALEDIAGDTALDMFKNTFHSEKEEEMEMLKSVLSGMPTKDEESEKPPV